MMCRFAVLAIFIAASACSADQRQAGTNPAAASAASDPTATSAPSTGAPAPGRETEKGVPAAYAKFCTGTLNAPLTVLRAEGAGTYGGYDEKAPIGTQFLVGVQSDHYTGVFVTNDGVWARLGAGGETLVPNVGFTSACAPEAVPKEKNLRQVTIGRATLFATQELTGPACIIEGGTVASRYGYIALGNDTAKVRFEEAKVKCGCDECYSKDIHVDDLIVK
jgi:hypothetical protein